MGEQFGCLAKPFATVEGIGKATVQVSFGVLIAADGR